ncbi:NAD-dependent malic enzyme [Puniceicoccus vermicola]|uniref:NAD-dependent malic enzyme n=1 Tax=Puniceicoccus vermicola TaxID=388746 RepID=A0A7X1B2C1_9BACT|nr:NAD-dependent malic enzyme [Puniceicoccus vermicola]MBC2604328.1 NAD-dependent malic enzyme [Puniceicoccus vermicola]
MKNLGNTSKTLSPIGLYDLPSGPALMDQPLLNKGTSFTKAEQDALGLRGLLPPRIFSMEEQLERSLAQFRGKTSPLEKYIFLVSLQHRNETLFYRLLLDHLEEMMPIIYTPTVGEACLEYSGIFRSPRGLWITIEDKGKIESVLRNWPRRGVRLIVVTDGERILGLGDLGALGMGIPIGKLALYTTCAGVHPYYCLPITIDVGTNSERLRGDPMYIGMNHERTRGDVYNDFMEEFVNAVRKVFPGCLLQFEDFGNANAFHLLEKNRDRICCFNDDIQGTAAVALAGIIASARLTGAPIEKEKLLFLGAGEAGTGIAELFVSALESHGIDREAARRQCWFVDSKGLLVRDRGDKLPDHKKPFAHEGEHLPDLLSAVKHLKPTTLIGVAGVGGAFNQDVVEAMCASNERPVIFALSNPTSSAECTAEEAYKWSRGKAVFASGSPFSPVTYDGQTFEPGQGNNVYIFPGVGLGALACGSTRVTHSMFLAAAEALAEAVQDSDLACGRVYPNLKGIRRVSLDIAIAVAEEAWDLGLAQVPKPEDVETFIQEQMFEPEYRDYFCEE